MASPPQSTSTSSTFDPTQPIDYSVFLSSYLKSDIVKNINDNLPQGSRRLPTTISNRDDATRIGKRMPCYLSQLELEALPSLINTGHICHSAGYAELLNGHKEISQNEKDEADALWFPVGPLGFTKKEFEANYQTLKEAADRHFEALSRKNETSEQDEKVSSILRQNLKQAEIIKYINDTKHLAYTNEGRFSRVSKHGLSSETEAAVEVLRNDLICTVGADVVCGTVFAHAEEKNDESGSANKKGLGSAAHPGTEISSFGMTVEGSYYTVPLDKASAMQLYDSADESPFGHQDHGTTYDSAIRQSREYDAKTCFNNDDHASTLPSFLKNPRDAFPELTELIMNQLCPQEAETIAMVPFKLVCYRDGDHFQAHTDSVTDPRHFAILAVHLPTVGDLESDEIRDDPDEYLYYDRNEQDRYGYGSESMLDRRRFMRNSKYHFSKLLVDPELYADYQSRRVPLDDEEGIPRSIDTSEIDFEHRGNHYAPDYYIDDKTQNRAQAGRLRFYLGRSLDVCGSLGSFYPENVVTNTKLRGTYDRPNWCSEQLVASVMMQNYDEEEVYEGKQRLSHQNNETKDDKEPMIHHPSFANKLAFGCASGSTAEDRRDHKILERKKDEVTMRAKKLQQKLENSSMNNKAAAAAKATCVSSPKSTTGERERKYLPLNFAAWNTQVLHDVEPLARDSFRFVLLYKVYRKNKTVCVPRIPTQQSILHHIARLGELFKKKEKESAQRKSSTCPTSFALLLRNQYPLECLKDWQNLKGIDLIAFYLITQIYECVLVPVLFTRGCTPSHAFIDTNCVSQVSICAHPPPRFLPDEWRTEKLNAIETPERKEILLDDPMGETMLETVFDKNPSLTRLAWIELGLGSLSAYGSLYANIDAGHDWHLKSTALVCTLKRSDWFRRKVLFLISRKGNQNESVNYIKRFEENNYPIFRTIAYFV